MTAAAAEINVANIANVGIELATLNHWYSPRWHWVVFSVFALDGEGRANGVALVEINYGPRDEVASVQIRAFAVHDPEVPADVVGAVRDALPGLVAGLGL